MSKPSTIIKGSVYHYQFIDHGAQYRVYAVHTADGNPTGRVLKVPLAFNESHRVLSPHLQRLGLPADEIDRRIHEIMIHKQQLPGLLQGMIASDKKLMQMLGDLRVVPTLTATTTSDPDYVMPLYFTQEHVTPMAQFLHPFRFAEQRTQALTFEQIRQARTVMQLIIELQHQLWEYGVFDMTHKIENIGVVLQNSVVKRVVLVDGAEHTYDFDEATSIIDEKKWQHSMNPVKTDHLFLPIVLHQAYTELMEKGLTQQALEKHWQRRSRRLERQKTRELQIRQLLSRDAGKKLHIWMERQRIHEELRRGIPRTRVDGMHIPYADLVMLLNDTRAGQIPLGAVGQQEKAERAMFEQIDPMLDEVFRHTVRVSDGT
ncbi:MAG TPA: hypothetical protein VJ841_00440 [Candidatus Saccharimonadales bacterium]|nr:hypothetical protein [Candidatus Saccharimonadales bacterium]